MKSILLYSALLLVVLNSCKDDDPIIPNEEEVITTLILTLTPVNGGDTKEFKFQDTDGDGGNAPILSQDSLLANTEYSAQVTLLNEINTPAENITTEVLAEAEEHQLFYNSTVSGLTVTYQDMDANNKPLGLSTAINTGNVANGQLTVTLLHEPDKSATNVSNGDITNAGGETDIAVTFTVYVL